MNKNFGNKYIKKIIITCRKQGNKYGKYYTVHLYPFVLKIKRLDDGVLIATLSSRKINIYSKMILAYKFKKLVLNIENGDLSITSLVFSNNKHKMTYEMLTEYCKTIVNYYISNINRNITLNDIKKGTFKIDEEVFDKWKMASVKKTLVNRSLK